MKIFKLILITLYLMLHVNIVFAEDMPDCSKIDTKTGSGWLKKALCKKGSDKLDSDGNFKKGTFNIFTKLKKN